MLTVHTHISLRCSAAIAAAALAIAGATLAGCSNSSGCKSAGTGSPTEPLVFRTTGRAVQFKVNGMACPNCAKHIAEELAKVPGVESANVDFDSATASVMLKETNPASNEQLQAAVNAWRTEHFAQEEDPECLDPKKRAEMKKQQGS